MVSDWVGGRRGRDRWSLGLNLMVPCSEHGRANFAGQDCRRKARGAASREAGWQAGRQAEQQGRQGRSAWMLGGTRNGSWGGIWLL
jgi:hypothetical protein